MTEKPPRRYALMGSPIAHSPSPAMQNAGFEAAGFPGTYGLLEAGADDLAVVDAALADPIWAGFNVTTPLKERVATRVRCVGRGKRARAVNTLWRKDGIWHGDNTDVDGVASPLSARGVLPGGEMIIIGSGGASRAAALAGELLGLTVHMACRRPEVGSEILGELALTTPGDVFSLSDARVLQTRFRAANVIVQSTPVGREGERHDLPWIDLRHEAVAFEMLYASTPTPFLAEAGDHGARCVEGWEMLLAQGAAAFSRWTGLDAPEVAMRAALLAHLMAPPDSSKTP